MRQRTVFARSALPLTTWFLAIRTFAENTAITAAELMKVTGITRPATAQAMLRRIRRAVQENNIQRGLAGLIAEEGGPRTLERQKYKTRNLIGS